MCTLNCIHNGPCVMALIYFSSSVFFPSSLGQEENHSWFLCCLAFPPFLSQLLFHEIWLLVFCFFSIFFSAKPKRSLLQCQPPLSAHHKVPKILTYQETILKLHSIKCAIPFKNRMNKLCFFSRIQNQSSWDFSLSLFYTAVSLFI